VTRVWPVFDFLFRRDKTGTTWLPSLIGLGSRADVVKPRLPANPGALDPKLAEFERGLPGPLRKELGRELAAQVGRIRYAYEREVPPPSAFLKWMLEHPTQLTWPHVAPGRECVFGAATQEKRKLLLTGNLSVRPQALTQLKKAGPSKSQRRWWAFEGFTSVDCLLETETLLLLIEGKRTEPVSNSTNWFPARNQIIRNLEVAQTLAAGRQFAVLLCSEELESASFFVLNATRRPAYHACFVTAQDGEVRFGCGELTR
jgi:hypothetical protein